MIIFGRYVDDSSLLDFTSNAVSAGPSAQAATNAFLCLTESSAGGIGTDDRVHISLLAVIASTGEVVYDDFVDSHLRTELEVRRSQKGPENRTGLPIHGTDSTCTSRAYRDSDSEQHTQQTDRKTSQLVRRCIAVDFDPSCCLLKCLRQP